MNVADLTRENRRKLEDESVVMVRLEGKFSVPMTVFATRNRYGNVDLQVQPVGGDGLAWVSEDRCTQ